MPKGFSLIEIVVSLALIAAAFVGYFASLQTVNLTRQAKHNSLAATLVSKKLEELRLTDFDALPASGIINDPLLTSLPSATSSFSVTNYATSSEVKKAVVTIGWLEASGQKKAELTTLLIKNGL